MMGIVAGHDLTARFTGDASLSGRPMNRVIEPLSRMGADITFGDLRDAGSNVVKSKADPRNYALLAELNSKPRTTYLAAVRNPNPEIPTAHAGGDDRG